MAKRKSPLEADVHFHLALPGELMKAVRVAAQAKGETPAGFFRRLAAEAIGKPELATILPRGRRKNTAKTA